jgi:hypothetical protein
VYVGSSLTYDGIASFDQQKNYLYYANDFEASFVYGVDLTKSEILPPVSINSDSINSYVFYLFNFIRLLIIFLGLL